MAIQWSHRETNLHGAEAPWSPYGHNGPQVCTAPRPSGHQAATAGHKFARRQGPVTVHTTDPTLFRPINTAFTRNCGETKTDPTRIRRGSDAYPKGEFGPETPFSQVDVASARAPFKTMSPTAPGGSDWRIRLQTPFYTGRVGVRNFLF